MSTHSSNSSIHSRRSILQERKKIQKAMRKKKDKRERGRERVRERDSIPLSLVVWDVVCVVLIHVHSADVAVACLNVPLFLLWKVRIVVDGSKGTASKEERVKEEKEEKKKKRDRPSLKVLHHHFPKGVVGENLLVGDEERERERLRCPVDDARATLGVQIRQHALGEKQRREREVHTGTHEEIVQLRDVTEIGTDEAIV
jgi:hypothetical protein